MTTSQRSAVRRCDVAQTDAALLRHFAAIAIGEGQKSVLVDAQRRHRLAGRAALAGIAALALGGDQLPVPARTRPRIVGPCGK